MTENELIVDAIKKIDHDHKLMAKAIDTVEGVSINGFAIYKDVWCWVIYKPSDIKKQPEYRGEPLVKVVPDIIDYDDMETVLNLQGWVYE